MAKKIPLSLAEIYPEFHIIGSKPLEKRPVYHWIQSSSFFVGLNGIFATTQVGLLARQAFLFFHNPASFSLIQTNLSLFTIGCLSYSLRPFIANLIKVKLSPFQIEQRQKLLIACHDGDLETLKKSKNRHWDWLGFPNGLSDMKYPKNQYTSPILIAIDNQQFNVLAWMVEEGTDILELLQKHFKHIVKNKSGATSQRIKDGFLYELIDSDNFYNIKSILKCSSITGEERLSWLQAISVIKHHDLEKIKYLLDDFFPKFITLQDVQNFFTSSYQYQISEEMKKLLFEKMAIYTKNNLQAILPHVEPNFDPKLAKKRI